MLSVKNIKRKKLVNNKLSKNQLIMLKNILNKCIIKFVNKIFNNLIC